MYGTFHSVIRNGVLGAFAAVISWSAAAAEPSALAQPKGPPVLTVEGNISVTNQDGKAVFDRDMLEQLGLTRIETRTPWHDDVVVFEGVAAAALMEAVGARGEKAVAIALNDYKAEIPLGDFSEHGVLFATRRDGQPMPVSDKGPVFIVYPYDSNSELHSQKYYSRSVWQLVRLIIK